MKTHFRALCLAATAVLMLSSASAALAQDKVRFTLTGTSMLYSPVYVAEVMGYFGDEKITPEIFHFKAGGAAALAAVLGGNMEVYVGAASSALRGSTKGADALLIAAMVTRYSIDIIERKSIATARGIGDASSEIDRFKSLKGLKIGVSGAGSGTRQIAQYALARAGLNSERDATMVFLGDSGSTLAAFAANRIDAATTSSPATEIAIRDHGAMLLVNGPGNGYSELDGFLYVGLIATKRWTDANPDLATRTVRSFLKAHQAMHDPKLGPQARDLVHAKYFESVDKAVFDAAWQRMLPGFATDLTMKREQIERVEKFLNEFSSEKMNADLDKVFTNRFVEAAAR
ncbi:MAG TPA: ABC transporter substrate-binding protein [Reyranella sp.]|nr:ABC transporter substrate-binding protein [Reyranella sp.]